MTHDDYITGRFDKNSPFNRIEKHEKLILILEAISTVQNRIIRTQESLMSLHPDFFELRNKWIKEIKTNEKLLIRLENYYKNKALQLR